MGKANDETMNWLCDIRLPAVPRGVRAARDTVDLLATTIPRETREDLRLLISEVATNAIRHGRSEADSPEDAEIRVRLGVDAGVVRVEVHDSGPGFRHVPRGPHAQLDSGWGVHFVHTLTQDWGAGRDESGRWIVWFEMGVPEHDGGGALMYGQREGEGPPLHQTTARSGADGTRCADEQDDLAAAG